MKGPFISGNMLLAGAAIFAIIIAGSTIIGTILPQNSAAVVSTTSAIATIATSSPNITAPAASTSAAATVSNITQSSIPSPLSLAISPSQIIEGDPVMIAMDNATGSDAIAGIKSALLIGPGPNIAGGSATATLHFIDYQGKPAAFYGTGINQTPGKATVTVMMKDGSKLTANFTIGKRVSPTESLPVPAQLGGNSTSSQEELVANLATENAELADIYSNPTTSFWTAPFAWPIHAADVTGGIVVTDPFGYERNSGAEEIIHKGTDFKAPPGTPVYAINAGYVRVAKLFTVYGNTVVVDHGMGIESFYMHLSKMAVMPGEAVRQGQLLGYSGETGYSEGPHLHLTIRIGGISIDPMKFYAFFGLGPNSTIQ